MRNGKSTNGGGTGAGPAARGRGCHRAFILASACMFPAECMCVGSIHRQTGLVILRYSEGSRRKRAPAPPGPSDDSPEEERATCGLLYFPAGLGDPFLEDLFRRLVFGGVTLVVLAAFAGGPLPDHEAAELRVAVPAAEEPFVELALKIQIDRVLRARVIPRLVRCVGQAAPADFQEHQRLVHLALE